MLAVNAVGFTFLCLYYVLFCVAHWIFCMKYWVIAVKMETIQAGAEQTKSSENFHSLLYYGILLLNVVLPVYEAVEGSRDLRGQAISFTLLIAVQIMSCIFLFDASRRIVGITRKNPRIKINVRAMCIHLIAYVLYIISLIQFYFTTILNLD